MRALRFVRGLGLSAALLMAGAVVAGEGHAPSDEELRALNEHVVALYHAGKYAEAIPQAQRYAEAIKARHGDAHTEYATAINNLAELLRLTNRPAEAEPLYRQALAIDEKSYGPDHPDVARDLTNLAELLRLTNRPAEAEPLMRRSLAIAEKSYGPEDATVALRLNNLAQLLLATNRLGESEQLMQRALAIDEKSYGPERPEVAVALNNLAELLRLTNRPAEAEPLYRRALAIDEKSYGPEHPEVGIDVENLAELLRVTNRLAEAEPLHRRALAINERVYGREHPMVAVALNNLAQLLQATNRLTEAEPLMRRALAIDEKSYGPEHPDVARDLNNLALVLRDTGRLAEAEPLMRRALAIDEKSLGPEHPNVARNLNNLSVLLREINRPAEAEPLIRRALAIYEKSYGPEHPIVATAVNNLGQLLQATQRLAEAEPLMRRALTIDEKSYGPEHPDVARDLNNLALLLKETNRLAEAEPLMRRALAIDEKSLGPEHPSVARDLTNLALMRAELGDWNEAVRLHARAKPIMTASSSRGKADERAGLIRSVLSANTLGLRAAARALYHADPQNGAARGEGFELAQWALQTGAADALVQTSVRFAKGAGELAGLVRKRQDFMDQRTGEMRRLDAAAGSAEAKAVEAARTAVAALDRELDSMDARLKRDFPDYADLSNPKPLTIAAAQALLKPGEVLILFLDIPQLGRLAEETLVWVIGKEAAQWQSIALGTRALSGRVAALRCGLDRSMWEDASEWPEDTALQRDRRREQQARRARCKELLGVEAAESDWPPFDPVRAYELYQALLAPFAQATRRKHLLIVPSGPLTTLPFDVLVADKPDTALTGMERYQKAAWLALNQPISILPSVGSLEALRRLGASAATDPYIGFGNPLLLGPSGDDRSAWERQSCPERPAHSTQVAELSGGRGGVPVHSIDLAELRAQNPLPETADELCAVAADFGVLNQQGETVWLGERATEHNVKELSRTGKLAHYKVVHFATHGLLSGESAAILNAKAEPGLVLTPPQPRSSAAELEEDDGLLSASEVAQLDLDADWVVLSACNTAAGAGGDAEALSGLARAFFYAKARALLVSHWPVESGAAVKLTTTMFAELKADPDISRAEALRRSMVALIKGAAYEAHPAYWAPFVLVGEGAR